MDQIRSKIPKGKPWSREGFAWLHAQFCTINQLGSFNCLLSDGDRLFAYFDRNGYNALKYLIRQPPYGVITLQDKDFTIDLAETKDPKEFGIVIATTTLTNEDWKDFQPGQLLVVQNGQIIYSD